MKKLILILFLSLALSGCITLDEGKSTNVYKKSDVVSTKKTTSINQTKESTSNNKKSDQKIIEWKCYKGDYKNKYEKHILTLGYLKDSNIMDSDELVGRIVLHDTSTIIYSIYMLKGVQHAWGWNPDRNKDSPFKVESYLTTYMIIMDSNRIARYYDFKDAKKGEKRTASEFYDCKRPETKSMSWKQVYKEWKELYGYDFNFLLKSKKD